MKYLFIITEWRKGSKQLSTIIYYILFSFNASTIQPCRYNKYICRAATTSLWTRWRTTRWWYYLIWSHLITLFQVLVLGAMIGLGCTQFLIILFSFCLCRVSWEFCHIWHWSWHKFQTNFLIIFFFVLSLQLLYFFPRLLIRTCRPLVDARKNITSDIQPIRSLPPGSPPLADFSLVLNSHFWPRFARFHINLIYF